MGVANVTSEWSSGNLYFKERVRGSGASIRFGEDDNGLDVYWYGETSDAYIHWDESGDTMTFLGGAKLTLGESGTGSDFTLYGNTAGSYCQWDASDDALEFTEATMAFGTLSSTEQNGVTLSASGNTSVLDVFADDGDTKLTDAVYTTLRSRTMIFRAMTEGTVIGSRGQLKTADEADLGPGVYAGVQGYIEAYKDFDVKSGGKVWGVDASLEAPSSGTVTVDSGGIMGGLHAELTGSGEFSSSGTLAGVYVDEQVTTGQWDYGAYITGADYGVYVSNTGTRGFYAATSASAPDLGDGYGGAAELNYEVSGEQAGHIAAASAWVNHNGTVASGGNMVCARTDGVYVNTAGAGDLSNAITVFGARMQLQDADANSDYVGPFSINMLAGETTDGLFVQYGGPGYEFGYITDNSEDDGKVGALPFICDVQSGTQYWIRLYSGGS